MLDSSVINQVIQYIQELYGYDQVSLHAPVFLGNEKKYLSDCIDSTFVSSVGSYVDRFERDMARFTGAEYAVAVVNGTNALQVALRLVGVEQDTEVLTQPLTFVATCNAVKYLYADPVFIDVDIDTMGMSPVSLRAFLGEYGEKRKDGTYNRITGKRISAVLPMHTFGHPVRIHEIIDLCNQWTIPVVEDAAESLGSYIGQTHTGLFGNIGVLSFNGNKTITTGGGGMIVTNNHNLADQAKKLTTTAKVPHKWEFFHDQLGYNYRLPNLNAALGCAQLEKLDWILNNKRETSDRYQRLFSNLNEIEYKAERSSTKANYWLNAIQLKNIEERNIFLSATNDVGIMTRPIWKLMNRLPMYSKCFSMDIPNAEFLEQRIVNIPSGVRT